ncbi:MAG: hypothetical protein HY782_08860 [Chloroflexi bacterium]|nr:hypothetical protein [Chloroflexota bacterium]
MCGYLEYLAQEMRYADFREQAERDRLAQLALRSRTNEPLRRRVLAAVKRRLKAMDKRLPESVMDDLLRAFTAAKFAR